ncbi:MerR family transcriptional regulator [Kitasatospora sp. NPDC006786]|uniref:MerR family transcriptional regulator n=1 Tax=unclassified Kitasatospora TaxID=2633591 RepID=UPI0033F9D161
MQENVITIGELAARTRLSLKALRLYDERGLLPPALVDARTGVRRYGPAQVERARRIALLRAAGLPLARIAAVLDAAAPDPGADPDADADADGTADADGNAGERELLAYWREREAEHAARREAVGYAREVLSGRSTTVFEIAERDVPEQRVLFVRRHVDAAALPGFLAEAGELLLGRLREVGACLSGPLFAVYHGLVGEDCDALVEVCAPTPNDVGPHGPFAVRIEPAHREAYTALTRRGFTAMAAAHDAVGAWAAARGYGRGGPNREVHYPNRATAGPQEPVVDVAVPLAAGQPPVAVRISGLVGPLSTA